MLQLSVPNEVGVEQLEPEPLWEAHVVAETEAVKEAVAHFEESGEMEALPDGATLIEAERVGAGEREALWLMLDEGLALELREVFSDTVARGVTVALFDVLTLTVPLWHEETVKEMLESELTVPNEGVEQLEPEPLWEAHVVAETEAVKEAVAHFEESGEMEALPDGATLIEAERVGAGEREALWLMLDEGLALELREVFSDTVARGVTVALLDVFTLTVPLWHEETVRLGEPVQELVVVDVPVRLPVPLAVDEAQPVPEPLLVADSVAVAEGEPVQELVVVDVPVRLPVPLAVDEAQPVPEPLLVADSVAVAEGEPVQELVVVDVPVRLPVPLAVDEAQLVPMLLLVVQAVADADAPSVCEVVVDKVPERVGLAVAQTLFVSEGEELVLGQSLMDAALCVDTKLF